ncbi:MAG TPA: hypothetical protein VNA23_04940, partial [Anaerolineales bacterium]|nr:hypothetical protein [Anaerolineales bacterium]
NRVFVLLAQIALVLSACAPVSTAVPQDVAETVTTGNWLIWQSNDSPCETAAFSPQGLSRGECGKSLTAVSEQTTGHAARLSELSELYVSFGAETPVGSLIFKGTGELMPTDAEKRALAEWAKLMFETTQPGPPADFTGLAFSWQRDGGVGGFCDDVSIYLTGLVTTSDCTGFNAKTYLTASQLEQLYAWVDGFTDIDYNDSTAPLADGMTITLTLAGNGEKEADEQTIRELIDFAATLDAQLGYAAEAGPDVDEAEKDLRAYLTSLHNGDYVAAAKLYGGDTSLLQTWNSDIPNADLPTLLERACSQNGLQCLAPRSITYRASEVDGHHFWVEFNNDDGTMFQQGPCCGETTGTPISLFSFFVEKSLTGSGYVVQDFPPYVP